MDLTMLKSGLRQVCPEIKDSWNCFYHWCPCWKSPKPSSLVKPWTEWFGFHGHPGYPWQYGYDGDQNLPWCPWEIYRQQFWIPKSMKIHQGSSWLWTTHHCSFRPAQHNFRCSSFWTPPSRMSPAADLLTRTRHQVRTREMTVEWPPDGSFVWGWCIVIHAATKSGKDHSILNWTWLDL